MDANVKPPMRMLRPTAIAAFVIVMLAVMLTGIDRVFFLDVANEIGAGASARAGGDYSIGTPEEIREVSALARGGRNVHARVVVEDDHAVTVMFFEDADAALFKRAGGTWTKVKGGILPDTCALMQLGVPWFTAAKLESAVFATEASPPHHDPCAG